MPLTELPQWIGTAVLGAVLALLGYVGKQFAEWFGRLRAAENARRARLAELLALIRAGDTAWKVQCENRDKLSALIEARDPALDAGQGYDHLFAVAFPSMPPAERELHDVVRAYTVHTFRPLNEALLKWIAADADFRVRPPGRSPRATLSLFLADLEAHLLLWQAKFAAWMPDHPERSLVYLDDEGRHGTPFPQGGARLVARILHRRWWRSNRERGEQSDG